MNLAQSALRIVIAASYYPSLWANRALCAVGSWNWWDEVDETVIVGAVPSKRDLTQLRGMGVRAVVNLCGEFGGHIEHMKQLGIVQLHLPTLDYFSPSEKDLKRGIHFLQEVASRHERAYVHCKAGRGRSATLVIAYVMATRHVGLGEAFALVRDARRQIDGHLITRPVLLQLEKQMPAMSGSG